LNREGASLALVYDAAYPFVEGGGQKRMFEVALRLAASGWKITWYALHTWDGPATIKAHGITYRGLKGDTEFYTESGRRSIREALSFGRAVWRARGDIQQHPILWCGQWPYFHLFALAPGYSGRLVVDWWETWGDHWYKYLGACGLAGKIVESAAARLLSRLGILVTVVPMGKADVLRAGARPEGVVVIPNGISLSEIRAVPAANHGTDIVYAGRLKGHKNVDHIVRALAILRDQYKLPLTASIVGDGPAREQLETLTRQLGLESSVKFHGALPTPAMLAIVKSAGVFVHPSTKEGGGSITLIEANACGVPVVIYRHQNGIDPNLIEAGINGWVEDEVSPSALAARLHAIMQDRVALSGMRNGCENHALESDWDTLARRYEVLFSAGCGQKTRTGTTLESI
jgi:glycosyltransferase involved in cell wall biosynthesis